jgi:hypothetical protein
MSANNTRGCEVASLVTVVIRRLPLERVPGRNSDATTTTGLDRFRVADNCSQSTYGDRSADRSLHRARIDARVRRVPGPRRSWLRSLRRGRRMDYSEPMKVAAYQAPLLPLSSMHARDLVQARVRECEAEGISVLCCPEAILGGLADYSANPVQLALRSDNGQLASVLAPLASDSVTSIIGFSELTSDGVFYNAAAIF